MFGAYRLLLACLVALSHFGLIGAGLNPGQWAVISFYVLSGFLMERQFRKLATAQSFYVDRFFRIFPLYIGAIIFASILSKPSLPLFLINSALIPLNYSDFTGVRNLIGPSWSLACEVQFYLLVPLLCSLSTRAVRWVLASSAVFFGISPFLFHSTFWAYTGLPGILFTFLTGVLISRKDFAILRIAWGCFAAGLAACVYSKYSHANLPTGIHINVCLGYLAALPILAWLSRFSPKATWDQTLGLLSYPLFLTHEPVKALVDRFSRTSNMLVLLVYSVIAAGIFCLVIERPFDRIRYRLRKVPSHKKGLPGEPVEAGDAVS